MGQTVDDYYRLLGVGDDVSDDELATAWRALEHTWHPDRAGALARPTYYQLARAYAVLSDREARVAYDRWRGKPSRRGATPGEGERVRAPGVMLERLRGPLQALLARGVATYAEPELTDLIELFLHDDEVAHGGMISISMRVAVRCPACNASATPASCARCDGTQIVEDVFTAWLAVRPGVSDGTILTPSAWLPDMLSPVFFRVRR